MHEITDVPNVFLKGWTRHAAAIIVFLKYNHCNIGTDETQHNDENRNVCLQEG